MVGTDWDDIAKKKKTVAERIEAKRIQQQKRRERRAKWSDTLKLSILAILFYIFIVIVTTQWG